MPDNLKPNHLIRQKSPYLLQHAYNPVNWYPWGEDAFSRAMVEDKPVFLSIGYSTCHWCHVMAHESFEDMEVAEILNRDYIAIKVDKEERPDIDSVYMTVCQSITGQGGWPLTIIMTPDQKPFFAATYIPKYQRYNIAGLMDLLNAISTEWKENRAEMLKMSDKIVDILNDSDRTQKNTQMGKTEAGSIKKDIIHKAKDIFRQNFDPVYGGFGKKPKFPTPHNLMFLLRYYKFEKDEEALRMVETTLEHMYRGGIFDHIGYGFARYSTDEKWLAPHFEKMLYDNALLAIIYLEAYQITEKDLYRTVAEKIFRYVLREMTNEEGGFYCAQDADSDGVEGKFYVFSPEEIIDLLGKEAGERFNQHFDITKEGNFEGSSIPNLIKNDQFLDIDNKIEEMISAVYDYRQIRTDLHKDDKILTSWNALMIVAFAKAFKVFEDDLYLKAAENAAEFIIENLTSSTNQKLFIHYRDRVAAGYGTLDDYAYFCWALAELYEADYDNNYLDYALKLASKMKKYYWDEEGGGFFLTGSEAEKLIYRPKETYDGAMPSGNSVAGYALMKLAKLTAMQAPRDLGIKQLRFLYDRADSYPAGHSFALMALMMELYDESFLCENGVCSDG